MAIVHPSARWSVSTENWTIYSVKKTRVFFPFRGVSSILKHIRFQNRNEAIPSSTKPDSSCSVDFTAPSMTLNCYQLGPLRSSCLALVRLALPNKRPAPYNLSFTFKERTIRRNRPRDFLSHEIHSLTPFHRNPSIESTPKTCKQAFSVDVIQTSNHVPTLQFLTTSLVYASIKVTGLLRPATDLRVRAVFPVPPPHY
jgi:hypothetical protein